MNVSGSVSAGYASGNFSMFGCLSNLILLNSYFSVSTSSVAYSAVLFVAQTLSQLNLTNSQINATSIAV